MDIIQKVIILKKEIYNLNKNLIFQKKEVKKILIIGGSQGASFFDNSIKQAICEFSTKNHFFRFFVFFKMIYKSIAIKRTTSTSF